MLSLMRMPHQGPPRAAQQRARVERTAGALDQRDTLPGVIHTELLARPVGLPPNAVQLRRPGSGGLTKPTLRQALRGGGLLCLPQADQGDARAFAFVVDGGPSRPQVRGRGSGWAGRQQQPLQRPLLTGRGQGP